MAAGRGVRGALVTIIALQFVIAFGVLWSAHESAVKLADSQRKGCERGKLDRAANARAWRGAESIRRAQGDMSVAGEYGAVARELEARSRIDCAVAFPPPGWVP